MCMGIHVYAQVYMCVHGYTCMCMHGYICVCTGICVCALENMGVHGYTCVCTWVYVYVHRYMYVRTTYSSLFSPSITWVPKIKFRLSGLAASDSTH